MTRKQVVFNIDDVGSTQSANAAMVEAFTNGVATSCGVMVPCPWFADAIALAKQHRIPVGVHMVTTCEYEHYGFGPLTREPRLSRDGKGYVFGKSGAADSADQADIVYAEIAAQVERVLDHGMTPTHLESHMMTIPRWDGLFEDVCDRLWQRYRIPFRDARGVKSPNPTAPPGMQLPIAYRGTMGDEDPAIAKRKLRQHLDACVPGINWILCHAAKLSPETQAMALSADFAVWRDNDLRTLIDPEVRSWLKELDIELVGVAGALAAAG